MLQILCMRKWLAVQHLFFFFFCSHQQFCDLNTTFICDLSGFEILTFHFHTLYSKTDIQ